MTKFKIFHQPKTGGTFLSKSLPKDYVLPHKCNYHKFSKNNPEYNGKLVAIIRNPVEYYKSLINFWAINPKYAWNVRDYTIEESIERYIKNKNNKEGHVAFWITKWFSIRDVNDILLNFLSNNFLKEHENKLSLQHHTYDYFVFKEMLRLDIGYYTFAFLDQYGNKKINEIKDEKDLKNVLDFVKNNFIIISQKNLNKEIKQLCEKFNVLFNENIEKQMVSNSDKLIINNDIIEKIKYKDRYLYELFKSFNFS